MSVCPFLPSTRYKVDDVLWLRTTYMYLYCTLSLLYAYLSDTLGRPPTTPISFVLVIDIQVMNERTNEHFGDKPVERTYTHYIQNEK